MARPRVFVSSTYYDLRYVRAGIELFLESYGYEPVLFETGDIAFRPDQALDKSCYDEIKKCHIFVLIIGGRSGAPASKGTKKTTKPLKFYEEFNSITRKEFETASEKELPTYIFVEKAVLSEYETYRSNKKNKTIKYAHADSVSIFQLIEDIFTLDRNNLVKPFERTEDITSFLRDQWAGLFSDMLQRKGQEQEIAGMKEQISNLSDIAESLKKYTETIVQKLVPNQSTRIIKHEDQAIHTSKLRRMGEHPMINFIIDKSALKSELRKKNPSAKFSEFLEEIYRAIQESKGIDDFVSTLRSKDVIRDPLVVDILLDKNRTIAERDFRTLKRRYRTDD